MATSMRHTFLCTGHTPRLTDVVRAENCRLWTSEGRRYLDLESGVWSTSLGHGHGAVTAAIEAQLHELVHTGYCYYHPVVDRAAAKLLDVTGIEGGKALFLASGSEAVELALAIAAEATGRRRFITLAGSYLGAYGMASRTAADQWIEVDWEGDEGLGDLPLEEAAAFVLEPGSSSGRVRFPPRALVEALARRVREAGGLVMANEVTTGLGRTGEWFGFNHYGLKPDLVAIGKGLGSGYPVSAVALGEVWRRVDLGHFHYAQSHQNDALGAAVALAVIEELERSRLVEKAREDGARLLAGLEAIGARHPVIREVRGRGLMLAVEFVPADGPSRALRVAEALFERGIILVRRPGLEILRLDPALTVAREDLDEFLSAFETVVGGLG
ncbi:aminotransferase class III-fold pyridoxal phosphate-dependent enzyme [Anaeromyxobacter diazotrophicus]|nr:aminotransferase class III-fold pyridoxal phosphate-dependent enzyme [Anaeromyxobacter diazotrophicus]